MNVRHISDTLMYQIKDCFGKLPKLEVIQDFLDFCMGVFGRNYIHQIGEDDFVWKSWEFEWSENLEFWVSYDEAEDDFGCQSTTDSFYKHFKEYRWKNISWECCVDCDGDLKVFSREPDENLFNADEYVECCECGLTGSIDVREVSEDEAIAEVNFNDW